MGTAAEIRLLPTASSSFPPPGKTQAKAQGTEQPLWALRAGVGLDKAVLSAWEQAFLQPRLHKTLWSVYLLPAGWWGCQGAATLTPSADVRQGARVAMTRAIPRPRTLRADGPRWQSRETEVLKSHAQVAASSQQGPSPEFKSRLLQLTNCVTLARCMASLSRLQSREKRSHPYFLWGFMRLR